MIRRVSVQSLAKINLDLRVLHKRADGFHELRTVFQTISLTDTIFIEYESARRTSLAMEDALSIPDNLILHAARAVLDATRTTARIRFRLTKKIPMGGGLGGGSSNAAAVLLALPVLAGKRLGVGELAALGADLGSDVPFFLTGGTAVAVGRGTETYPLPDIAEEPLLVVSSGLHVATGPAYQALERPADEGLTSPGFSRKINSFQSFVEALVDLRSAKGASAFSANDFESVVFGQSPQLKTLWGKLRKAAEGAASRGTGAGKRAMGVARMTGSGSALFALFRSQTECALAEQILKRNSGGAFADCRLIRARLVSRRKYQRLWQRQLAEHLAPARGNSEDLTTESLSRERWSKERIWLPPSRYAR